MRAWPLFALLAAGIPAAAQNHADRVVAEWMIRMGGSVVLEGERRPVTDLARLPDGDFRLHTLNFSGVTQWAFALEDELKHLPPLPHLKEIYVNGRLWYDQPVSLVASTLAVFAKSTSVEKLILSKPVQTYIPLDDSVLKGLEPLADLRELRVHQTRVPGPVLAQFKRLTHLDLNYDRTFDDQGMASLKQMAGLTKLFLRGTSITDAGLAHLADLQGITDLDLADTAISDRGLAHLASLTKLRRLNLRSASITDAGLDALRGMTALEELNLYRSKVTNAGLAKLRQLKNLRAIDLRYSRTTDAGIREMAVALPGCKVTFQAKAGDEGSAASAKPAPTGKDQAAIAAWIRSLGGSVRMQGGQVVSASFKSTAVTDRELAVVASLPLLTELSLRDTEVSELGLAHLALAPAIEKLDLSHTLLSDSALAKLSSLARLRSLTLTSTLVEGPGLAVLPVGLRELKLESAPVTDEGAKALAGRLTGLEALSLRYTELTNKGVSQLAALKNLKRLDLRGVDVTGTGLESLAGLTALEALDLSYCRFGADALEAIVPLRNLKRLGLSQTRINNDSMAWIAKLEKLESIELEYTAINDEGLARLAPLTSLKELKLDRTDVSDASVKVLTGFTGLQYLDAYHTLISQPAVDTLRKALPNCRINWALDATKRERRT